MRARAAAYPLWKRGNEMDQTIAFLGGDARMRLLAQMMAAEGYDVCSWELTGAPKPLALCDALKADIIVLPLPAEKNGYLSGTELTMESLLRSLRREHRIFAGNVGNDASTLAQSLGLTITDYFASEELSVRNAIPTAEGAIEAAMKHTSVTLHGTPCLVLGFGRIGKVLAHDLSALGAKVSVSARKRSDLAWIDAFGYAPLHTNRLSGTLGEFRVVFNTVPHQVLDETLLAELPPDCLLIELASASGFDMDAVETLRLSYLKAGGLPGRVAPETAARAIKKTLCRLIKEEDVYKRQGMVFQKPNPFPMSIYDNIAYGPRTHGVKNKAKLDEIVEKSLRGAAIWDEVKDRLKKNALGLSGGQQQRLCIARALAVEPEVLLMDEPTSALDPISTSKIEELAMELKEKYTIVIVTHNMQQAVRISDHTAFFLLGELVEYGETEKLFSQPQDKRTEDYITGRFG